MILLFVVGACDNAIGAVFGSVVVAVLYNIILYDSKKKIYTLRNIIIHTLY